MAAESLVTKEACGKRSAYSRRESITTVGRAASATVRMESGMRATITPVAPQARGSPSFCSPMRFSSRWMVQGVWRRT
ncbi:MAG: hypothetical protein BWY57_03342 [Betaproteobacteria bacterium ADurb.Bin341]|nr:MAG: hypothetical protein BWY57_03342 [Betaproteobacteria bacterium ADurb.Bin341]